MAECRPILGIDRLHAFALGQGPTAIAKALGISRMSVHRALTGA